MADDFKAGDIVRLKSGGPKMTVDHIGGKFQSSKTVGAWCIWFDDKGTQQKDYFELTSIEKV